MRDRNRPRDVCAECRKSTSTLGPVKSHMCVRHANRNAEETAKRSLELGGISRCKSWTRCDRLGDADTPRSREAAD